MSPNPLSRCAPAVGLTSVMTAVSSIPSAQTDQFVGSARFVLLKLFVAKTVAPVAYAAWSESNGSMASAAIHHPSLGAGCPQYRYGDSDTSRLACSAMSFHVVPPSVLRQIVSIGL